MCLLKQHYGPSLPSDGFPATTRRVAASAASGSGAEGV